MEEQRNSRTHNSRLTLPGFHRYVKCARRFLVSICRMEGVSEDVRDSLALALTEILNNSIDHGECSAEYPVEVEISISPETVRLVVTETGSKGGWKGADLEKIEKEVMDIVPDDTQFRGRGLLLVCSLMDEMKVRSDPNLGTIVEVAKYR